MKMKVLLTLTAVALLLALAPAANAATIQIQYQVDAGPIVTCTFPTPGPVACLDVAGPPMRIFGLGANSDSPGTPTLSVETSADVDLTNLGTSSHTIQIQISADGFTAPVGSSLALSSHIGGTVLVGDPNDSLSFQSCIDPSNALRLVGSLGVGCPVGAFASGVSVPPIIAAGSFGNTNTATIGPLSSPYSISEGMLITLAPNAEINWSASTTLQPSAVPEPASSILLLGTGLVGLGAFAGKRLFRK